MGKKPTQDEIDDYMSRRARPYEVKTLKYNMSHPKMKDFKPKDAGALQGDWLTHTAGLCPCATCGHEYMLECEREDCQCCSPMCT